MEYVAALNKFVKCSRTANKTATVFENERQSKVMCKDEEVINMLII